MTMRKSVLATVIEKGSGCYAYKEIKCFVHGKETEIKSDIDCQYTDIKREKYIS